ncbi:hypothetical protein [Coxiella burnetii]|uniref:Hypothetical membrane associated protein n=1 Tax=Coxiella burnetii (strain RSA 493 / Nine Mile phase I) TaxID=227377 RepID=Q83C66_COXBU|nr:hypothetical protein [Coxiella burnetii]NP_820257.1 membrane-associated protein [Coxiella burnetii RSA 493]AAO90771.1 hypothetical membrane associated protein [Coxiella burnetii RSA 493]ARI66054.1 hypothetical protein B7L74_06500 [Coxiella burnetii]ARK27516.1 hypothetical protein BMW92_06310 [Coxiella burnetii]MCF2094381.1 hypothetical protein [Coxiella burnetii]MCF2095637.1 hypothetical protein [Coxiella burnetii]
MSHPIEEKVIEHVPRPPIEPPLEHPKPAEESLQRPLLALIVTLFLLGLGAVCISLTLRSKTSDETLAVGGFLIFISSLLFGTGMRSPETRQRFMQEFQGCLSFCCLFRRSHNAEEPPVQNPHNAPQAP